MFLLGDHIIWLHRNNLIRVVDVNKWQRFSNKAWLYSVILNLIRDYRELKNEKSIKSQALIVDTLKNVADFWLPMTSLNHVEASPVFVGIMGVISSVLSALPLIDSRFKF